MSTDVTNCNSPNSQEIDLKKELNEADCRKLAWNYRIHAVNGRICAEKEINIWIKKGTRWKRIHHIQCELKYTICIPDEDQPPSNPSEYVYVDEKGIIQFAGGYLEIEDIGLLEPLSNSGIVDMVLGDEATASVFWLNCSRQPDYYDPMTGKIGKHITMGGASEDPELPVDTFNNPDPAGKNIHLEVEFESFRQSIDGSMERTESGAYRNLLFHPIFYLPQNSNDPNQGQEEYGQVYFGEWIQGNEHAPYWGISKNTSSVAYPYELHGLHQLVISQDADRKKENTNTKETYFEFFANSIGLKESFSSTGKESHFFGKGTRIFYVGYAPAPPAYQHRGSVIQSEPTFRGGIRRIFFDPNSQCPTCGD